MVDTANTAAESHDSKPLRVGLDIGSTTVKAVVLDQTNALNDVLFSDYRRHHANVRATVAGLLKDIHQTLVDLGRGDEPIRLAITGSGGLTLAKHLGVPFVQEVIAVSTALQHYAAELGLVFQIVDDILDVTATTEELGKPVGSDAENDKTTFITLYGLEGARSLAKQHNDAALAALANLGPEADFLREMAVELLTRSK